MSKSSTNPFRDPLVHTSTANASSSTSGALNSTSPSLPTASSPRPASSDTINQTQNVTADSTTNSRRVDPLDIPEEDPPAYTPGPDFRQGEATVEYGPSRPFQNSQQQAPPISQQSTGWQPQRPPQHPGHHSGWNTIQNHVLPHGPPSQPPTLLQQITGNLVDRLNNLSVGGSNYPGTPPPGGWRPPPGHPPNMAGPPLNQYQPPAHPPPSPSSDFAKDFYAAGTQFSQGDAQPSASTSTAHPTPPQAPPNDGKPTRSPTPGHPLLNKGNLLVYPAGYVCKKCNNVGYKQADPSHPCKKCWNKYAKPFSGPLIYTDFSSPGAASGGSTFQKPLPAHRPPQQAGPGTGYPGTQFRPPHAPPPPPPPPPPPLIQHPPMGYGPPPPNIMFQGPGFNHYPPGSIFLRPGDPRIGGRMCWKCDGDGRVNMLFWEDRCDVCGGSGRVF